MKAEFGKHFIADLYLCQRRLWENPQELFDKVREIAQLAHLTSICCCVETAQAEWIRIWAKFQDLLILLHVFPEEGFLTIDLFSWQSQFNIQDLGEGLIELFNPQVVAAESRLRGEHLKTL